jgi:hypothetical protein
MKLWNDQSGNALVFAIAPEEKSASLQELSRRSAEVAPATFLGTGSSVRMTQHCCFHCTWCEAIISLPHDRLGLVFGGPAIRRYSARSIATVCGACHHVGGYSLFRGCAGFDTRHKLSPAPVAGITRLVDLLRCEEATCAFALPLFVTSERALTSEAAQELAKGWAWEGLKCATGHHVHPPAWVADGKPLRFPAELK